jgi:hypothetical protein
MRFVVDRLGDGSARARQRPVSATRAKRTTDVDVAFAFGFDLPRGLDVEMATLRRPRRLSSEHESPGLTQALTFLAGGSGRRRAPGSLEEEEAKERMNVAETS